MSFSFVSLKLITMTHNKIVAAFELSSFDKSDIESVEMSIAAAFALSPFDENDCTSVEVWNEAVSECWRKATRRIDHEALAALEPLFEKVCASYNALFPTVHPLRTDSPPVDLAEVEGYPEFLLCD